MTALLKEIKYLIVIINHFFFTRIGFILKVFVQVKMCFSSDFRLFFFELQVKKLNLVLNCNVYHWKKYLKPSWPKIPFFWGFFVRLFVIQTLPGLLWFEMLLTKLKSTILCWVLVATVFSFLLAGISDKINVSELLFLESIRSKLENKASIKLTKCFRQNSWLPLFVTFGFDLVYPPWMAHPAGNNAPYEQTMGHNGVDAFFQCAILKKSAPMAQCRGPD